MTKINSLSQTFNYITDCLSAPYIDGYNFIKKGLNKERTPSGCPFDSSGVCIDPSNRASHSTRPLKERISQVIYGVSLMIPVINLIVYFAAKILYKNPIFQQPLLPSVSTFPAHRNVQEDAFNINLALLHDAYKDPGATAEDKKLIEFLASNYLNHVTPKHLSSWIQEFRNIDPNYQSPEQTSPFQEYRYHREILDQRLDYGTRFNAKLGFGNSSLFLLTDNTHIDDVFPIQFQVLSLSNLGNLADHFMSLPFTNLKFKRLLPNIPNTVAHQFMLQMDQYLKEHLTNPSALNNPLKKPLLLDLSLFVKDEIITDCDETKEKTFHSKYDEAIQAYEKLLEKSINQFAYSKPEFTHLKSKIFERLKENTTCIARTKVDNVSGIKVLPYGKYLTCDDQFRSPLIEFMVHSGISIGAINLRKLIPSIFSQKKEVPQLGQGASKLNVNFFDKKDDFTNLALCKRLKARFNASESLSYNRLKASSSIKSHYLLFGKASINLIEGLITEISDEQWNTIKSSTVKNYLCQTALYQLSLHLANAEGYLLQDDFACYMQEMEIVNAEIQKLLTLFTPFKKTAFGKIFKDQLLQATIPVSLAHYVKAGVGRSATNIFAGVTACAKALNPSMESVHASESYYEQQIFMKHGYDEFLANPKGKKLDVYHAQFNPNVNVGSTLTEYKRRDIAQDIRTLFQRGLVTDNFTAAIDITIDEFHSENVRSLLQEFQQEIIDGKINFVFFASGQKFSNLGMDTYYGAPFYIINNNHPKWGSYSKLLDHPSYSTDSLSYNFFCLSTKYASDALSNYRKLIFENTQLIMKRIPEKLLPDAKRPYHLRVNTIAQGMLPAFIDLKVKAKPTFQQLMASKIQHLFIKLMIKRKMPAYQRGSFGFFHCNFAVFGHCDDHVRTIRINPGVNPEDNATILEFLDSL